MYIIILKYMLWLNVLSKQLAIMDSLKIKVLSAKFIIFQIRY